MKNKWDKATMVRRIFRPRVLIYSSILLAITVAMIVSLANKHSFKVDVIRDRGVLARIVEGGNIENVYTLQVMNATEKAQTYDFAVVGLNNIKIASENTLIVNSAEARGIAVRVRIPYESTTPGSHPIEFKIHNANKDELVVEKSVFIVPR